MIINDDLDAFTSPAAIDTIEYAYLEGQDGVFIESRTGFDVEGVQIKARLDFGARPADSCPKDPRSGDRGGAAHGRGREPGHVGVQERRERLLGLACRYALQIQP